MSNPPTNSFPPPHPCPRCGAEVTPNADECPSCGQTLCPVCSAAVGENDLVCRTCGAELELSCPTCGAALKVDDVRCPKCGTSFQQSVESEPPPRSREQLIREAYRYGAKQIKIGVSGASLEAQLIATGLDPMSAMRVAGELATMRARYLKRTGKRDMLFGVASFIVSVTALIVIYIAVPIDFRLDVVSAMILGLLIGSVFSFIRGLAHVMRNSGPPSSEALTATTAQSEAEEVWRGPRTQRRFVLVSQLITLGGVAAYMALRLSTPAQPLIDTPAIAMALSPGDLGAGFTLVAEDDTLPADQNVRDVNLRVFQSNDVYVQLSVVVGRVRSIDQPTEVVTAFAAEMRKGFTGDVSLGTPRDFAVGDRGTIQEFTVGSSPNQAHGYIAVFIKNNVLVVLTEVGPAQATTMKMIETHARIIESRMH